LFHRVQRDKADFASQLSLSKESKYPMVIRIEEGWTMVQEAMGQTRKGSTKKPMSSDVQHLNPVVMLTAEQWFPGQRIRTQNKTHAVHGSITVSVKQTSAVMAVPFSTSSGLDLSTPEADVDGAAGVVTEAV
jgi:hypothetical protein